MGKIYTKKGDSGATQLVSGNVVSKSNPRVDCYGSIDELNSFIGLLSSNINDSKYKNNLKITTSFLTEVQHHLFNIGSHVACDSLEIRSKLPPISKTFVSSLESLIDSMQSDLPSINQFILPGGHVLSSTCHICRTITRRCERILCNIEDIDSDLISTFNRLSDYFFVLARYLSKTTQTSEIFWDKNIYEIS